MDNLDELEHPLLGDTTNNSRDSGPGLEPAPGQAPGGLLKGILVKCEEDRAYPPLAWRNYCGHPPELQQQQLLDPCSLPRTLESFYPAAPIWGHTDSLLSKDYLETTFVDIRPGSTLERKLLAETQDFHSVSYSMDDEDDLLPDSDVRHCTDNTACAFKAIRKSIHYMLPSHLSCQEQKNCFVFEFTGKVFHSNLAPRG